MCQRPPLNEDPKSEMTNQTPPNQIGNPNSTKENTPSVTDGLFFQFRPETEKDNKNPQHPCNPRHPCQKTLLAEKTIEDVLLNFGETKKTARRRYREFVEKGIKHGTREDLQGGGLVRSAGGETAGLLGRAKEDREKGDARILGTGEFVNQALMKAGKDWEKRQEDKISLPELVGKVASHLDLNKERIISASRRKEITDARALVCHFAINNLSYSASEVARALAISRVNAGRCAERGKKVLDNYEDLKDIVQ